MSKAMNRPRRTAFEHLEGRAMLSAASPPVFSGLLTTAGVTRASTDVAGVQGNGVSFSPVFSPDGSKVAFYSAASKLVPGDTNGTFDLFVKNLATGAITRESTTAAGGQANGYSGFPDLGNDATPAFSPDGSKVAFYSDASNLVPGDTNGVGDIFVKDLLTGAITRVSTDAAGGQGNGFSGSIVFSPDGSKVAFSSAASNLVPGDTNGAGDVFVKNLVTGAITRVSTGAAGGQANGDSESPVFSPDGLKVAFYSFASNLVSGDTNGAGDVFVKDLATGAITRVSTDAAGGQANFSCTWPVFSPDGSKVAFRSAASNLVPGDTNGSTDIFVKDLTSGAIKRVSTNPADGQANGDSGGPPLGPQASPVFGPDGSKIAFYSSASNLVPGDTNDSWDIFVKDLVTGAITRVSTDATGGQANGGSFSPVFSRDGSKITFYGAASNLGSGDTNDAEDVFVASLGFVLSAPEGFTTVATLGAIGRNPGTTLVYSVSGTDAARFTINATTGALAFKIPPNFSSPTDAGADNVYDLLVTATDGISSTTVPAKITVTQRPNKAPTSIALSASSIKENNSTGATIGKLSTTDPDLGDTFTYTLVPVHGSTDSGSFMISGEELKAAASFDYETKNSYSIQIRSTDRGGLSTVKTFTITVLNVTERPAAPGAPTGVSGAAGNSRVTLTWTAPAYSGSAFVTDYKIQYSTNNGGTWRTFSDGIRPDTTAIVTGLTNGVTYVFRVFAINAAGTGTASIQSAPVTPVASTLSSRLIPGQWRAGVTGSR